MPVLPVSCFRADQIQELKYRIRRALFHDNAQAQTQRCITCNNSFKSKQYTIAGPEIYQRTRMCEYCYDALILQRPEQALGRLTSKGSQLIRLLDTLHISDVHICLFPRQASLCRSILQGQYSFTELYIAESDYGRAVSTGPALHIQCI